MAQMSGTLAGASRDVDDDMEVQIDRGTFVWDGVSWYDKKTYLAPPSELAHRLNGLLQDQLAAADAHLTNPVELVREATRAKNAEQYPRSERLSRRALQLNARNEVAATVLSSALRAMGRSAEALEITGRFPRSYSPALLTTRAAAQCDLGLWAEALGTARRALAVTYGRGDSIFAVIHRIRANAPELF